MQRDSFKAFYTDPWELALAANQYARMQILAGGTQLKNNELGANLAHHLWEGVGGMNEFQEGTRDLMDQKMAQEKNPLETDEKLIYFETTISVSSKFSLGNCEEYAFQALDFVLSNGHPDISAEICRISGKSVEDKGDHTFLVLNRKIPSDINEPDTWGEDAIICDPWANRVYKASRYRDELQNYYYVKFPDRRQNYVEPYNPNKHKLEFLGIDTELRNVRNLTQLKLNFERHVNTIIDNLNNQIVAKEDQQTEENSAAIEIEITEIQHLIIDIENKLMTALYGTYSDDYRFAKAELIDELKEIEDKFHGVKSDLQELTESYFKEETDFIIKILNQFSKSLDKIKLNLAELFGEKDKKALIITKKIADIHFLIETIQEKNNIILDDIIQSTEKKYSVVKKKLREELQIIANKAVQTMCLKKEEQDILFKQNFSFNLFNFGFEKSKTKIQFEKAQAKIANKLKKRNSNRNHSLNIN